MQERVSAKSLGQDMPGVFPEQREIRGVKAA